MSALKLNHLSLERSRASLKPRPMDAHKGDFGHVLVVGGDYGFGGAVRLAAETALRSGAGLVSVATRPEHAYNITGNCPEIMCHAIFKADDIEDLLKRASVVILGPGLGQGSFGKELFSRVMQCDLPLLVDADGLNFLSLNPQSRDNWILTPHPGEASRLLKLEVAEIQKDRVKSIQELQKKYQGVVVLKGSNTLILGKHETYLCEAGNPGMATAGMGDVLSGVIGALMAQGLPHEEAANLGVIAHAIAGDMIAKEQGERGMMAGDLIPYIRHCLNP